ncbi:hypothetical protein IQ26_02904 [Mesorhizobium tianshanense]|uniref:Uncharacterized protein n=1 Tax=Mesorhizobium tianshanense TaxID=39844 RepID=A0A562NWD7_9HYPH|nr:hypothetical protein IQ26_02904 [Mesorhizobium tianshanense]
MGFAGGGSTTPRASRYTGERRPIRNAGMTHETFWFRAHGPRDFTMKPKVTVEVKVNVALCLFGIAAILSIFF